MANPEHLNILKQGVEAWNNWRMENPGIVPDLNSANLRDTMLGRANLSKCNFSGTNLSGAVFRQADLNSANLIGADLRQADLNSANLIGAILMRADLHWADLTGADLSGAFLSEANLNEARLLETVFKFANIGGVNFADSTMGSTIFVDVNLSLAKGLETVKHVGPSSIGFDTIQRSRGKIPDAFLRGVGLSDEFIAFIRAMGGAIQFYSCFISYSGKDQLFAERLYADLQARGVRCWFAPHDVQAGKKLHEQIDDAIRVHERLLLILSPESIHSEWVKTEIAKARKREMVEKRRMLFPVLLKISYEKLKEWECFDADTGKDSAREIREYYIPNFSEWESPEKFKEEFEKLVRDLKKAEASAAKAG